MTQISLYYNSASRLACDCVLPAQVLLCVPVAIIAPREATPNFEYHTIEASITARSVINDCCGGTYNKYTISYDDTQLVGQIPLRADQIQGIVCRGCLTNWVEDVAGDDVVVIDNGDSTQTLVNQHGGMYPLVVTGQNLLNCEYVASQFGGTNQAALANAIATIAGAQATLYIDCGAWAINANQTIPSNIRVEVLQGAMITVAAGTTLTINGPFAAPSIQIFTATGNVRFGDKSVLTVNALWFGSSFISLNKAIESFRTVTIPSGTYTGSASVGDTEVVVNANDQELLFTNVTLKAGANSVAIIRVSAADCTLKGSLTLDGNGFLQVSGVRLAPANEAGLVLRTTIDRNSFSDILIQNTAEGIVLVEGPTVLGVPSTTENNNFVSIVCKNTTRGVWFKDGPNIGSAGCNRNNFFGVTVTGTGNTGVTITNGSSNTFTGCSISGRASGVSPNVTPTGIQVVNTNAFAVPNNSNVFIADVCSANTLDLSSVNPTSIFLGCQFISVGLPTNQRTVLGSGALTQVPIMLDTALIIQDNVLIPGLIAGLNVGRDLAMQNGREQYDYGYPWQTYNLLLANITNASAIAGQRCRFKALNRFVHIILQFTFTPVAAPNPVDVDMPGAVPFDAALYVAANNSMAIIGCVRSISGGGPYVEVRSAVAMEFIAGNKLRIFPPAGGWTLGTSAGVTVEFDYRL